MHEEVLLKKVLYRACYRSGKEADFMLGDFAKTCATTLSLQELKDLDALLQCDDRDIFAWIDQRESVPCRFDTSVLKLLRNYIKILKG